MKVALIGAGTINSELLAQLQQVNQNETLEIISVKAIEDVDESYKLILLKGPSGEFDSVMMNSPIPFIKDYTMIPPAPIPVLIDPKVFVNKKIKGYQRPYKYHK